MWPPSAIFASTVQLVRMASSCRQVAVCRQDASARFRHVHCQRERPQAQQRRWPAHPTTIQRSSPAPRSARAQLCRSQPCARPRPREGPSLSSCSDPRPDASHRGKEDGQTAGAWVGRCQGCGICDSLAPHLLQSPCCTARARLRATAMQRHQRKGPRARQRRNSWAARQRQRRLVVLNSLSTSLAAAPTISRQNLTRQR